MKKLKRPCVCCGKKFLMAPEREAAHLRVCPIYQNLPASPDDILSAMKATAMAVKKP